MKNYPRIVIQDLMQSLYYLYSNNFIEYEQLLFPLNSEYHVHHIEITDNEFICYQMIDSLQIKTSIPI